VALVLGGDGSVLRAAEDARPAGVPLLGVNLGHVGFLAESEVDALDATVTAIVDGAYEVEQRFTLRVTATYRGEVIAEDWAMNEVSVEKSSREKLLEVAVSVDERPLLRFGCDGIICATPTGSTAYAFSVGGPVVWPSVEAMLLVPNAAHALFQRPLVIGPSSQIGIELVGDELTGVVHCDGRRTHELPGRSILLTGASGGVGHYFVELAAAGGARAALTADPGHPPRFRSMASRRVGGFIRPAGRRIHAGRLSPAPGRGTVRISARHAGGRPPIQEGVFAWN